MSDKLTAAEVKEKPCRACGDVKPLDEFPNNKLLEDGRENTCKKCRQAAYRDYYAKTRDDRRAQARKYYGGNTGKCLARRRRLSRENADQERADRAARNAANPQVNAARGAFSYRVKCGKIKRPDRCSLCGTVGAVDGHHEDYSKPFDVVWLCHSCHMKRHQAIKDAAEEATHELHL